ncbi:MAG TPA: trehalase family glycosidase [Vitreimonas sp.]|nr:trehalase family glycosidase [Vitreimonas sp.]
MAASNLPRVSWWRRVLATGGRVRRLIIFGFEQIVLSRLFEGHRPMAQGVTAALLKTKSIEELPPELTVSDDEGQVLHWTHGFSAANAALFLNLRNPDSLSPVRHARPSPSFQAIYLWDSAFIAQVWKWWSPAVAHDVLNSVIRHRDGARLQHFVSEFTRSEFTQPPLIAWSLQRLADAAGDEQQRSWVAEAYEPLRAYHAWLQQHRRLQNGLYAWAHAYESGVENAPRFGDREERRLRDTRRIAAPDLSTYMVIQCEALAAMARGLGKRDDATAFLSEANTIRGAVNAFLWDESEGYYFDRSTIDGHFIRARTIASILPLWAGIPDERRASALIEHILDPGGFNTLIPLPSVAIDDPAFERDMWRGPVWINTAFAVIEGMRRYGFHEQAADFAYRLCDGIYRTYGRTGRFYEFYDPTSYAVRDLYRKRGNRWKAMTLGKKPVIDFVGWTGLVNTLAIETLFGVRQENGRRIMQPRFPKRAVGRTFALSLPLWETSIRLEVLEGGAVQGRVETTEGMRRVKAKFGETVFLDAAQAAGAVA